MADAVLFDARDDGIAIITLNRPETRNALGKDVRAGLFQAWDRFERDPLGLLGRRLCAVEVTEALRRDGEVVQHHARPVADPGCFVAVHLLLEDLDRLGPGTPGERD